MERHIPPRIIPSYGNSEGDISTWTRRNHTSTSLGSRTVFRGHQRTRCRRADLPRTSIISPAAPSVLRYYTTNLGSSSTLRSHSRTGG
ncbi:hypothetical protein SAM9427_17705 [Streptomyces sp. ETH9427]|nr:hypothetical protein SAM9427_17705 [Streptomyces sp. ETH9427]